MKRIVFMLLIICATISTNAQLLDNSTFNQDVARFNATGNKKKDKQALAIYNLNFHDEKGLIRYQCVIPVKDPSYMPVVISMTRSWFEADEDKAVTKYADNKESVPTMKGICYLGILASHNEGLTYNNLQMIRENIDADANVVFEFKEDRLRMSVYVNNYTTTYSVVGNDVLPDRYNKNYEYPIYNLPPFKDSTYKKSWLSAYIGANAKALNLVGKYMDFINAFYVELLKRRAEDEQRSNDNW